MKNLQSVTENLVLFSLDFHIISGSRRLQPADLDLPPGTELPPETVASLGSKNFVSKDEIRKFTNLYNKAKTACLRFGVKFLGGFAVAQDKAAELEKELDQICVEFNQLKADFSIRFDQCIDQFASENPSWAQIIRAAPCDRSRIDHFMGAAFTCFEINPAQGLEGSLLSSTTSLSSQLYRDVADIADKLTESLNDAGPTKGVTQKSKAYVRNISDKLNSLSFLDGSASAISAYLDSELASLPMTGRLKGRDHNQLAVLASALSDPTGQRIKALSGALVPNSVPSLPLMEVEETDSFSEPLPLPEVVEVPASDLDFVQDELHSTGDLLREVSPSIEEIEAEIAPEVSDKEMSDVILNNQSNDLKDVWF